MDYLQLSECVNLVESYLNISDVVARYANLKKVGEYYLCRCIFHDDDGESLIVNPEKGKFYCPVCHTGGNALKFLAMAEKIRLFDALESKAKEFRLELYPKKIGFEEARYEAKKRELAEIKEYASDFYHEILINTDKGAVCRKYLESRGISNFAIEKFNIGYASEDNKNLTRFLYEYNFNVGMILESGFIARKVNLFEDKFQKCVVFPFSDEVGKVTAIIGRVIDFEKQIFYESDGVNSKYIYPEETSSFNKRGLIFGLNIAYKSAKREGAVIIVEDCLDAVILSSTGFENVVAIPENNLTSEIAKLLTKYAKRIIFCLKYGDKLEIEDEILKSVANDEGTIFIAALPEKPIEYLSENGKDAFFKYIKNPVRFDKYKFFTRILSDNEPKEEIKIPIVHSSNFKHPVEIRRDKFRGVAFLKLLCLDMDFLDYVSQIIPPEIFDYEPHREIYRYLQICLDEDSPPDKEDAIEYFDKESYKEFLKIMADPEVVEEVQQTPTDAIIYLESDKKTIRKAAEDATQQLLNKMVHTDYSNLFGRNPSNYEDFKKMINNLNDIKQLEGR